MLKYVLALLALVVVSLAPVHADEGYIPYFPDFLEPDGIGFRGPTGIRTKNYWAEDGCNSVQCGDLQSSIPEGSPYVHQRTSSRASPFKLEYRKNYFFKKLLYLQSFADFGQTIMNGDLKKKGDSYSVDRINSDPFLIKFLTAEEKSKLLSLPSEESNRAFDLKTESNFILFGTGVGLDLWLLEFATGAFLMYHDTSVTLRSCKFEDYSDSSGYDISTTMCQINPNDIIDLNKQHYSGFGIGTKTEFSLVFLQTENWRISLDWSGFYLNTILDSSFKKVNYRGLEFYPEFTIGGLSCEDSGYHKGGEKYDTGCRNSEGVDMSRNADYTKGFQITYYFR